MAEAAKATGAEVDIYRVRLHLSHVRRKERVLIVDGFSRPIIVP